MNKNYITILLLIFALIAPPLAADDSPSTSDPSHKGYYQPNAYERYEIKPVTWVDRETDCVPCKGLFESYNRVVSALLEARYRLEDSEYTAKMIEEDLRDDPNPAASGSNKGLTKGDEIIGSYRLNRMMHVDTLKQKVIPNLKSLVSSLTSTESELRSQLEPCEKQCSSDSGPDDAVSIGSSEGTTSLLPFDWKGPYPEACHKCAKLAARLNELPRLAYETNAQLHAAQAEKVLAEARLKTVRSKSDVVGTAQIYREQDKREISELEEKLQRLESEIARHQGNLEKIKANFNETLVLYNECLPTCKPKKTACVAPQEKAIQVGPNGTYGSGAKLQEKVTGMVTGMLGSVLGGSGLSFGGGGDDHGSSQDGPDTVADPTTGDFRKFISAQPGIEHMAGVEAGGRLTMVDGNLVASVKLDDVPGDGTFHSMWVENQEGKVILPIGYLVISLYQDWKLTVWWTHDRWVNGEHVLHEEGREVSYGTEELGTFYHKLEGEEGVKNSIWYTHGFNTATKGINQIAAIFPITQVDLSGPCPMHLVTHVTLPGEDPVIATPLMLEVRDVTEAAISPKKSNAGSSLSWDDY